MTASDESIPPSEATEGAIRDHATEFYSDSEAMEIEDSIWWARGRRSIIRSYLERATEASIDTILEIGCGSGGDLSTLAAYGRVLAIEQSAVLAGRARRRGVAAEVYETDFFDQDISADVNVFCLFDVLEHIEHDDEFICRIAAKTNRDHTLLISVPACQFLFGRHDELLHHYRRYSRGQLEALLTRHGYEIVHSSYFMFLLFPVAVLSRCIEELKRRLGHEQKDVNIGRVPGPANWLFTKALQLEAWLGRLVPLPIGLWLFTLARRRSTNASAAR